MFIEPQDHAYNQNLPPMRTFQKRNRLLQAIAVIVIVLLFLSIAAWPLINRFMPPKCHSGMDLYTSGAYLKFEHGEMFRDHIFQLPFAKDASVCTFQYYDFWMRDAVLKDDPFSDVYLVQLIPTGSYDSITQHLETNNCGSMMSPDGNHVIYFVGEDDDTDCFYVSVNIERQEIFCILITDCSAWAIVDSFLAQNLGWVPGA